MQQAVLNLALNARDAMPSGGDLTIRSTTIQYGENNEHHLPAGDYVVLSIKIPASE